MQSSSQEKTVPQCLHDCAGDIMAAMLMATYLQTRLQEERHPVTRDVSALLQHLQKSTANLDALRAAIARAGAASEQPGS
jgi:hypothetical protein